MHTELWIERVIIQQLSHHDRQYKHDYRSGKDSTAGFVVDCGYLETMMIGDDIHPSFEQSFDVEETLEPDVRDALKTLHQQELILNVGELPRSGPFSDEDLGSTELWELTDDGLKEARELNEAYSTALDAFEEQYEVLDVAAANELINLSKNTGKFLICSAELSEAPTGRCVHPGEP